MDNEISNRVLLERILSNVDGCTVVGFRNGEEGLNYMQDHKVDLILLDLSIPVLDGFGVTKNLQQEGSKVPVILVTVYAEADYFLKLFDAGIVDLYN